MSCIVCAERKALGYHNPQCNGCLIIELRQRAEYAEARAALLEHKLIRAADLYSRLNKDVSMDDFFKTMLNYSKVIEDVK